MPLFREWRRPEGRWRERWWDDWRREPLPPPLPFPEVGEGESEASNVREELEAGRETGRWVRHRGKIILLGV